MGKFKKNSTSIEGVYVIEPTLWVIVTAPLYIFLAETFLKVPPEPIETVSYSVFVKPVGEHEVTLYQLSPDLYWRKVRIVAYVASGYIVAAPDA